ncbi:hypothetical protein [Streptacidiphilus cavernicola]|uniref:Uncharacterized protein n=1 Tax=Streptacidiphilus cavernicola TaxID=3342716 RepID=A0ABV6VYF2_9ACTN
MPDIPGGLRSLPLMDRTVAALKKPPPAGTDAGTHLLLAAIDGVLYRLDPAPTRLLADPCGRVWSTYPDGAPCPEPDPTHH